MLCTAPHDAAHRLLQRAVDEALQLFLHRALLGLSIELESDDFSELVFRVDEALQLLLHRALLGLCLYIHGENGDFPGVNWGR